MSNGSNIPQEIMVNILSRLPAKPLCRFKSVSKPWRALISDPHFTTKHLNQHKSQEGNTVILIPGQSKFLYSINFDDESSFDDQHNFEGIVTKLNFPFLKNRHKWIKLLGSCNGLLLVASSENSMFLLNPSTRESKQLPFPYFYSSELECSQAVVGYGFGYDSSSDDYKAVKIIHHYYVIKDSYFANYMSHCQNYFRFFQICVCSLKNGCWTKKRVSPLDYMLVFESSQGVLVNGHLHWLGGGSNSPKHEIVALDLASENFSYLAPPKNGECFYNLAVLRGCLCILAYGLEINIWMMEKYGVEESWTKHKINLMATNFELVYPFCLGKDGKYLLNTDEKKLVVYDPREEIARDVVLEGITDLVQADIYQESLLSPDHNIVNGIEDPDEVSSVRYIWELVDVWIQHLVLTRAENNENISVSFPSSSRIEVSSSSADDPFSLTSCLDCLRAIEVQEGPAYEKALKMFEDSYLREVFINMPDKIQRSWLNYSRP